jgi:hypothetical protein
MFSSDFRFRLSQHNASFSDYNPAPLLLNLTPFEQGEDVLALVFG